MNIGETIVNIIQYIGNGHCLCSIIGKCFIDFGFIIWLKWRKKHDIQIKFHLFFL
jgi:hypothetical protein